MEKFCFFQKELFLLCFYKQIEKKTLCIGLHDYGIRRFDESVFMKLYLPLESDTYPFLSKKFSEFVTKIAALFFPSLENISVTLETEKMNNEYIH